MLAENALVEEAYAARKYQTWTIAAFLVTKALLANPNHLALISFDEDSEATACTV